MNEAPSIFSAWSNFYTITGTAAASLTGLMFVVVTLVAGERTTARQTGLDLYSTPTVVHFVSAFLISAVVSAPWHAPVGGAWLLGIAGFCGVAYTALVMQRIKASQTDYVPDIDDWTWYTILPLVAYLAIAISGVLLPTGWAAPLYVLAGATMLLIFSGIHNAWDVVTYLAIVRHRSE